MKRLTAALACLTAVCLAMPAAADSFAIPLIDFTAGERCIYDTLPSTAYQVAIVDREEWVYNQTVFPYTHVAPGEDALVCLWVDPESGPPSADGGFDFLVCYDSDALTAQAAWPGPDLHPEWEYFIYRIDQVTDTCPMCPGGYLRVIGLANIANGVTPPDAAYDLSGCVAELTFRASDDPVYAGWCVPVGFCALDCGDNVISNKSGDTLFLPGPGLIVGPDYVFDSCVADSPGVASPHIDYSEGSICIDGPSDFCGDLNLNGIPHELADAVLYSNFFIYGTSVFDPIYIDHQLRGSEINCDSLVATTVDLTYLINIITGELLPPECCPFTDLTPPMQWVSTVAGPTPSEADTMRVVSASAGVGDTFTVDIYVRNVDTLNTFNFRLRYDPTVIQPLTDTLILSDTTITLEPPEQLRGAPFEVHDGGFPSDGILTFLATDFDNGLGGSDLFLPGAGAAVRMSWVVLPSAIPQAMTITFENDADFPHSYNTMVDLHAAIWKKPELRFGIVVVSGGICECPYQGDMDADGFITATDLAAMIDALFAGGVIPKDPDCPINRLDLNCSGFEDAVDLALMIDFLFAGGPPPCDPCAL